MSFRYTKRGIRVLLLSVEKKKQFKARTIESEINGEFCEMWRRNNAIVVTYHSPFGETSLSRKCKTYTNVSWHDARNPFLEGEGSEPEDETLLLQKWPQVQSPQSYTIQQPPSCFTRLPPASDVTTCDFLDFSRLFSCLVTSVECYPCDFLVSGMMSSDCCEIKYLALLALAKFIF